MSLRERFIAFDDRLAKLGVPPLTAWWRDGIGEWLDAYERGQVLRLFACVGRGAAKSTALYKLALFFTLFGDFMVPIGERHFAIILSRLKEEAQKGAGIISRWLTLLGVPHRPTGDVIELADMPRGIRIVAASVAATSGWRAFFVAKDERSKWTETGVEEREGEEIDVSASAMTATHALAPELSFGSAFFAVGPFFDAVMAGSDESRVVLGPTPTWIAAPHITEESTRRKERNEGKWRREYACEFASADEECLYSSEALDASIRRDEPVEIRPEVGHRYVAWGDTGFSRNSCTLVIGTMREVGAIRRRASIVLAREWRPRPGAPLDPASILREWAQIVRPYLIGSITIDQYHFSSLQALAAELRLGVTLVQDRPTVPERLERYENVLSKLLSGDVELPAHPQVRADLLAVRRHMQQIRLPATPDGRHADFAPPVVGILATLERATGQTILAEQRSERNRYRMAYLTGDRLPELAGIPESKRSDATLALANGVPLQAVVDPSGYIRDAQRAWRDSGAQQRDLDAWDEHLRRIGSPGWSGAKPEKPDPDQAKFIRELEARVLARQERGKPINDDT